MKNVFKALAIIALAALIAFSMAACDDGSGGPGGGGDGGGSSPNGLTVTGLPSGDWYAHVFPQGTIISSRADYRSLRDQREVFSGNGGNTFRLHLGHLGSGMSSVRWTGSGNRPVVLDGSVWYIGTVNFSNGSVTVPLSDFRQLTD